ncbi:CMRF35-like molecule 8 isoform X2 [Trachypithecus francoisi]|uniref:CMRF35-like molecule 8 isoform X2 n=1 Tax=Trachypithecus francoisi TaxID=54180 RepID=UPI00141B3BF8|nr:CMRF35-like molecule 8 isoform X2 [Trachypithecus francoisi]
MWLPWALLLLWVPGCFALRGPSTVDGPVGGSLSVQCWYEKEHKTLNKYWCRPPRVLRCDKIVETKGPAGIMNGRVSITDCPANLSFTVTLKNLTEEDAGTYWCGVDTPLLQDLRDPYVQVEVSVFPASTSMPPTSITAAKTSIITTVFPSVSSTSLFAVSATHSTSNQEESEEVVSSQLPLLLSLLALLLLLLLIGTSLLAWRMFQKWIKAGEHSELSQNPKQAAEQSELHYANLELLSWPLQEEPAPPREAQVEYSTVAAPREELHYASVVFDSNTNRIAAQRPQEKEPDSYYSVIKKT